jgi:hypothetical protein
MSTSSHRTKENVEISRGYIVVPVVLSVTGVIPKTLERNLKILSIKDNILPFLQKAVLLQTVHITRKFLNLD